MKFGVYRIRNQVNGKCYIGSTSSCGFDKRFRKHRNDLKAQRHHSRHLQNAWNKYNFNTFVFEILLYCDPENCLLYEQVALDCFKPEYNVSPTAGSSLGIKRSAKSIAKRRASMPDQSGENNPFYGKKHSQEWIEQNLIGENNPGAGLFGELNPNSKLTNDQRREIYRLGKMGLSQRKRAEAFGVSKCPIARIDKDDRWAL